MTTKYEYKFVTIKLVNGFLSGLSPEIEEGYRNDITENAKEGWRFVQAFAPSIATAGISVYADLIFEREIVES
jgi:uncharacterized protein DUF4177